ncbi:MAG: YggS family pyridoxal phosphate-dependent enzyme [Dehalococcoidia bacterium]|nr:YggS family pyridoxal phosphate-dependent enzyme [Dehalococcoidia bacterium]
MNSVAERVHHVLQAVPPHVTVVAAAKGARLEDLRQALEAGIQVVGQNHIREARDMRGHITLPVQCHFIGRLRPHSVRATTLRLFDMVQSVDSLELAERIESVCAADNRTMPVLIEVNSGREPQKAGAFPEDVEAFARDLGRLAHLRVVGLMTMGPVGSTAEDYRPHFVETRQLFEHLRALSLRGVTMQHLSMGMSGSYEVAIEEGATMVRLGTALFGPR